MKVVLPSVQDITPVTYQQLLKLIERAGRVCYKSEDKITDESAEPFIKGIIKRGHEAVLEHGTISIIATCDRGVSHEIVRHRIGAYCQESTRYCNYSKGKFGNQITCVMPSQFIDKQDDKEYENWFNMMEDCDSNYTICINEGWTPEQARAVLPNSLKTEIAITYNIREWRHFLKLRTSKNAHPDMRHLANLILTMFKQNYPAFFEDIEVSYES